MRKIEETTLHKDGRSALLNIALEKEGEKEKKQFFQYGSSDLVTHPSNIPVEQGLTLLIGPNTLLSLWCTALHLFMYSLALVIGEAALSL